MLSVFQLSKMLPLTGNRYPFFWGAGGISHINMPDNKCPNPPHYRFHVHRPGQGLHIENAYTAIQDSTLSLCLSSVRQLIWHDLRKNFHEAFIPQVSHLG